MKNNLLIFLAFLFLTGCFRIEQITTTADEVICVVAHSGYGVSITCNWDEYNLSTAYGCIEPLGKDDYYFYKGTEPPK